MADLTDIQAAQAVKVVGSDSSGNETNPVAADSNGNLLTKDYADGLAGQPVPLGVQQVGGTDGTNLKAFTTDTSGNQKIVGSVASLAADSGNPVKTGAVFNTTLPAPTNGQIVNNQANQFGMLTTQFRNKYTNVKGNTGVLIKTGSGVLHGIMLNNPPAGGTIIICNSTFWDTGNVIATINSQSGNSVVPTFIGPLGCEFTTGLYIQTAGSLGNDFTILYY